jgi:hypothetical protein
MEVSAAQERQALIFGLAAITLWSTVATGFKLGLTVLAVEQLLLLGSLISWCVFALYALYTNNFTLHKQDRSWVVGLGCINPFGYYLLLFAAYDRLPAHIAQPLNYTWAIVLALLAVPVLKQKLARRTLLGITLSYTGVVVLLWGAGRSATAGLDMLGVVLALLSTGLWAIYWLLNTRCTSDPGALMFWSFSVGVPLIALACWIGPGWPTLSPTNLAYGLWVGAVEMGVTFLLWQQALKRTHNVARMGQLIFLSPFLSLLLIAYVLQEDIAWSAVIGLVIIVAGLLVTRPAATP